jgi:hypothetical protein
VSPSAADTRFRKSTICVVVVVFISSAALQGCQS